MQRRKFLATVGSVAAGSAAVLGTGAYTQSATERVANVNVVNDSVGLVGLYDETPGDVIRKTSDGELLIDFTADGSAGGVNQDARYQVGKFTDKGWAVPSGALAVLPWNDIDPAFSIQNNDTISHSFKAVYEANANSLGNASVFFQFLLKTRVATMEVTGTDTTAVSHEFPKVDQIDSRWMPGDSIHAVMLVDTRGVGDPANLDLSGTLTIEAGEDPYL